MLEYRGIVLISFVAMIVLVMSEVTQKSSTEKSSISDETLEATLKDKRYLMRQLKCALGEGPCDPVGRRLKSLAPLVLQGSCSQCTEQEQRQVRKVLGYMQVNFPKEWNKILRQYAG